MRVRRCDTAVAPAAAFADVHDSAATCCIAEKVLGMVDDRPDATFIRGPRPESDAVALELRRESPELACAALAVETRRCATPPTELESRRGESSTCDRVRGGFAHTVVSGDDGVDPRCDNDAFAAAVEGGALMRVTLLCELLRECAVSAKEPDTRACADASS